MNVELLELMRSRYRNGIEEKGFNKLVGVKLVDLQEGSCVTELEVGPEHHNPNGWLHGGAIMTLCDTTAGNAAATLGYRMTTVNLTIEFMRRGPAIGKVTCKANVVKAGRNLIWTKAALYDEERLLCEATLVYFCLEKMDFGKV